MGCAMEPASSTNCAVRKRMTSSMRFTGRELRSALNSCRIHNPQSDRLHGSDCHVQFRCTCAWLTNIDPIHAQVCHSKVIVNHTRGTVKQKNRS